MVPSCSLNLTSREEQAPPLPRSVVMPSCSLNHTPRTGTRHAPTGMGERLALTRSGEACPLKDESNVDRLNVIANLRHDFLSFVGWLGIGVALQYCNRRNTAVRSRLRTLWRAVGGEASQGGRSPHIEGFFSAVFFTKKIAFPTRWRVVLVVRCGRIWNPPLQE